MTARRTVYLDCHATTPVDPQVADVVVPLFTENFGNASSSIHRFGWNASAAVERARLQVAALIGARPTEIVFTSGATESLNIALQGAAASVRGERDHIVTQVTEHPAVLATVDALERQGLRVTRLPVDRGGRVSLEALKAVLDERTLLVAVMLANNEVGTVQPMAEIGRACRDVGALFLCDLTQGVGWHPVDVDAACIDLAALSGHKIYGPKGAGALFVRRHRPRVNLGTVVFGGKQERGLRPGTLNVPGIAGLGAACALQSERGPEFSATVKALRDRLQEGVFAGLEDLVLNGCPDSRHPGNLNISVRGLTGEEIIGALPEIAFSTGSACASASGGGSYVIAALGADKERMAGAVRFGVSKANTVEDIDYVVKRFVEVVHRLRERRG